MSNGIYLKTGNILITSNIIKIVANDYGEPDLEITNPYEILLATNGVHIKKYLGDYTDQTIFSFRSDDILTIFTPKDSIINLYEKEIKLTTQIELDFDNSDDSYGE